MLTIKAKAFMQTLVYPAFLGTFLVEFFREGGAIDNWPDARFWLTMFMLFYFASLFVETETTDAPNYNLLTCLVDAVEVAAMTWAFRLLDKPGSGENLHQYYMVMSGTVLLPIVWRFVGGQDGQWVLNGMCLSGAAAFGWLGAYRGNDYCVLWSVWPLLLIYFVYIVLARTDAWAEIKSHFP